jgi:hypothetical protein
MMSPDACGDSWTMRLVQVPGRDGPVDLDELVDRLVESGLAGATRRDVGEALRAGKLPTPSGRWTLLVTLPGQPWAYVAGGSGTDDVPLDDLARVAGLRVLHTGYSDFSGCTSFDCRQGDETLVHFESCNLEDEVVEEFTGGFEEMFTQTIFRGGRLPKGWLAAFDDPFAVQDALAREFDAYIPYIGAHGFHDMVELSGFDDREFGPEDFARIDLIGFGDARLEPSPADRQLRDAIGAGDVAAVRSAVAAGADVSRLVARSGSPLLSALGSRFDGHSKRRALVATLLELGADPNDPGVESPVHALLEPLAADEAEIIDLLELVVARGADVNARGRGMLTGGQTPLHVAARRGWLAVAKYLVSRNADVHATDARGKTPRQQAADAAESIKPFNGGDPDDKYAPLIAFLAGAEQGLADLDWQADAAAAGRRELRRRREMKLAFGKIGAGFQALGKLHEDDPSAASLAEAATFAQPDEIQLRPGGSDWPSEATRAETAAVLADEGFVPIGRYEIPQMPYFRIEAYHHPRESLYAAIYDAAGQSLLDLVRYHHDGTRLTATNNTTPAEAHFEMPSKRTLRLPGATPIELLRALRAEAEPAGGTVPVTADEFVTRFQDDYRREIKARKRASRRPR